MKEQVDPDRAVRPPDPDPYGAAARTAMSLAQILAAFGDAAGAAKATREAREALARAARVRLLRDNGGPY